MEFAYASLRLPADLKVAIEKRAAANRRSVNGEITVLLEAAVAAEGHKLPVPAGGAPAAGEALRA